MTIEQQTKKPIVIPQFSDFKKDILIFDETPYYFVKAKIIHILYPMFELAFAINDDEKFFITNNTLDIDFQSLKNDLSINLIINKNNIALRGQIYFS